MSGNDALYVLPALRAARDGRGRVILTRKFRDGAAAYAQRWPGPVVVCMRKRTGADDNLDQAGCDPDDLPFTFQWLVEDDEAVAEQIAPARLVLATLVDEHTRMAGICARRGVSLVYITEQSLHTRRQIIRAETSNPLLRWRRDHWTTRLERRYEDAVRQASGVQCNGTPAYEAYRSINAHPLLYFDTRVPASMLVETDVLEQRTKELVDGGPLRLAFSGRLVAIKGVDHLPRVAAELRSLGVPFTMDICGGGDMEDRLRDQIRRLDLGEFVRLRGVLDFETELMPFVAQSVDLFVCCHMQGDPSCTYLETMSCGTPIVGYDNEAFAGLVRHSLVGWFSPMGRPKELARRIADLDRDRKELAGAAFAARQFATEHTFEDTIRRRIDHMKDACAEGVAP
jgi:glycosyltransferase involved in cell wall biosynthesis